MTEKSNTTVSKIMNALEPLRSNKSVYDKILVDAIREFRKMPRNGHVLRVSLKTIEGVNFIALDLHYSVFGSTDETIRQIVIKVPQ